MRCFVIPFIVSRFHSEMLINIVKNSSSVNLAVKCEHGAAKEARNVFRFIDRRV